jgi:hypothetical protein
MAAERLSTPSRAGKGVLPRPYVRLPYLRVNMGPRNDYLPNKEYPMLSRLLFALAAAFAPLASVAAAEEIAVRSLQDQRDLIEQAADRTVAGSADAGKAVRDIELSFPTETLRAQEIPAGGTGSFEFTVTNKSGSEKTAIVRGQLMSYSVFQDDVLARVFAEYTFVSDRPDVCLPPVSELREIIARISFRVSPVPVGGAVTCRYRIERSTSSQSDLAFDLCGAEQQGAYLSPICPHNRFLRGSLPDLKLLVERVGGGTDVLRLTVRNHGERDVNNSSVTTDCHEFGGGFFGPTTIDIFNDVPGGCPLGNSHAHTCLNFTGQNFENRAFELGPIPARGISSCLVRVVRTNRAGEDRIPLFLAEDVLPLAGGGLAYDPNPINDDAFIVADPVPANLRALTGTWYEPQTSGQGLIIEVYPGRSDHADGLLGAGWFTHSEDGSSRVWYTLAGPTPAAAGTSAQLAIYANYNGNFAMGPATTSVRVGTATLAFSDCNYADLAYAFDDGRSGSIPIRRLAGSCSPSAVPDQPTLRSGMWSEPHLPGQGLAVEVARVGQGAVLLAGWFTYAPDGTSSPATKSQRWYALQGDYVEGSQASADVVIYETIGGQFDRLPPRNQKTSQVGTGKLSFRGCDVLTLEYVFTAGEQQGRSGALNLSRVGPTPPGCE